MIVKQAVSTLFLLTLIASSSARSETILSDEAQRLIELYDELHDFKDNPHFHEVGFGQCCSYHGWLVKIEHLKDNFPIAAMLEIEATPADLQMLGMSYFKNKGEQSEHSRFIESLISRSKE